MEYQKLEQWNGGRMVKKKTEYRRQETATAAGSPSTSSLREPQGLRQGLRQGAKTRGQKKPEGRDLRSEVSKNSREQRAGGQQKPEVGDLRSEVSRNQRSEVRRAMTNGKIPMSNECQNPNGQCEQSYPLIVNRRAEACLPCTAAEAATKSKKLVGDFHDSRLTVHD